MLALHWISGGQDCPPHLHVSAASGEGDGRPVDYADLSDRRRAQFEAALADGPVAVESTDDAWVNTTHVRYRGEAYAVAVSVC